MNNLKPIYPIKKTVRINKKQDRSIKKNAKKFGGESSYIRLLLDNAM